MKNVVDITKSLPAVMGKAKPEEIKPAPAFIDEKSARVVNSLFRELQSIFPAWRQAWPTDKALDHAKATWTKGFRDAGITSIEQIKFGIQACRSLGTDFAPSVGKFIQMCQPTAEMLGLPSAEKAYAEACRNAHPSADRHWTHAAVMHATNETGFYNLNTLKEDESRKLFMRNYEIACRMVEKGEPLKEIPKALPAEVKTPANPSIALAELKKMREMVRGGRA
ncbi:phage replication protein P [Pseudomonas duriflava]|uniref:Phage replication protein P n=1 Tax=Pseudomonas duriflava TaxID=459528 RepID=A0A562PUH8_9PSED|nr:replication protein P [Pseudomonas duriflava]TWI48048.1 phage replication protein P [Pseudomonas duriflava]